MNDRYPKGGNRVQDTPDQLSVRQQELPLEMASAGSGSYRSSPALGPIFALGDSTPD
jgi:hypothetical protein